MISMADIDFWVRDGESETLKFKSTPGERRQAVRTVCALLNHRGGRALSGQFRLIPAYYRPIHCISQTGRIGIWTVVRSEP